MSETYPIKDKEALHSFRDYYKDTRPNPRNYSLIVTGLNTAFRISDLLSLRWRDVCRTDGYCAIISASQNKKPEKLVRFLSMQSCGKH